MLYTTYLSVIYILIENVISDTIITISSYEIVSLENINIVNAQCILRYGIYLIDNNQASDVIIIFNINYIMLIVNPASMWKTDWVILLFICPYE